MGQRSAVPTAPRDRSEEQFRVKSSAGKVSGHYRSRSLGGESGIEENNDRGACAAERCAEDARSTGQFLQAGQQRTQRSAVWLMHAVFERDGKQFVIALRE